MADKKFLAKLANVPLAKPGFDALGLVAPVIMQCNPQGKWQSEKPSSLDTERLKAVVQHLYKTQALSGAHSYCCGCAQENKNAGLSSTYVPVIMMPIYPSDQCPFDMECEVQKMQGKKKTIKATQETNEKESSKDKGETSKPELRRQVLQRFTDFDLLSQW